MNRDVLFDKWWGRIVGGVSLLFVLWFLIQEREGLPALFEFIAAGLAHIPQTLETVSNHYQSVAVADLGLSLLIGAGFGAIGAYYLSRRGSSQRYVLTTSIAVSVILGALGSQILVYPMQHCSYSSESTLIERLLGYLITIVSSLFFLIPFWTLAFTQLGNVDRSQAGYFKSKTLPWLFLTPTLVSLAIFLYYPAAQVASLSLKAQRFRQERFVCLQNYFDLAEDVIYQNSVFTTMLFTIAIVIFSISIALGIALLASQEVKGASIYRTLLIWPYALSPVVTAVIFLAMFRQGRSGLINFALFELFETEPRWLTNPALAPWVVIIASVWNALGFNILFYIAGLQNIPKELLEAAQIDGANVWQRFYQITFPLLAPFTFFLVITTMTYSFYGIYGAVDTLTQGGPPLGVGGQDGGATNVLIYKLYEDAFAPGGQLGGAAAQSIIMFVLVAVITFMQFSYVERRITYLD